MPWAVVFAATFVVPPGWYSALRVLYFLVLDLFVIALGVSVLKYRLYDIDIVVDKSIVYGALAAFITAVYVATVFGISALVGANAEIEYVAVAGDCYRGGCVRADPRSRAAAGQSIGVRTSCYTV
jgi:hypothetical protein